VVVIARAEAEVVGQAPAVLTKRPQLLRGPLLGQLAHHQRAGATDADDEGNDQAPSDRHAAAEEKAALQWSAREHGRHREAGHYSQRKAGKEAPLLAQHLPSSPARTLCCR
jgi:hypothetical protein